MLNWLIIYFLIIELVIQNPSYIFLQEYESDFEISDTQLEQSADEKLDDSFEDDHRVSIILVFVNVLSKNYLWFWTNDWHNNKLTRSLASGLTPFDFVHVLFLHKVRLQNVNWLID